MKANPVADFGQLALLLCFLVATWAGVAAVVGARRRTGLVAGPSSRRLIDSAIYSVYGACALLSLASALIFFAILANDYSIIYVQLHSDATMPWYYKITSYWGGLDGSMMFWAWLLSGFSAIAIYFNRERHRELIPWVITILMVVLDFFLLLVIFEKRPFDTFLTTAPVVGKGLNPLLQNPYMATHPPSLYLGLVSATVPFAFGMAALISGQLDDAWLRSVRRWVLVSWFFLSLGLTLGMLWAYEVLGWGGYWGWDPVENAGALAWFTNTAFLHSVMVQERRGMLKVWNLFLVISSFILTVIATFLTRSGVVQSVHAFGSDPILKISFLIFIGIMAVFSYGLLIYRIPLLRSRGKLDSWVSREFAFLVNNWILLSAAIFILIATLFPSISEMVTKSRITIATPFYTQWMTPIGLALLFLTGVGPLIAWRHATPKNLVEQFAFPVGAAVVTGGVLALFPPLRATTAVLREDWQLPVSLVCFALCAFVLATIAQEFWRGTRVRQAHTRLDFFTSLVGLVARNKRRYGGYLVHVAIVMMFVGFAGGSYKKESDVTLQAGQQTVIGRYTVRFLGLGEQQASDKAAVTAELAVLVDGKEVARARPAKWFYPGHEEEPVTHVEIGRSALEDLYVVLSGWDADTGVVSLKLVVNPLVNWIWAGFLMLAIGTAIAFSPERAFQLAEKSARQGVGAAASRAGMLALLFSTGLGLGLVGQARPAHADEGTADPSAMAPPPLVHVPGTDVAATPRSPEERELFGKLVCTCGGCKRELLSECTCGFAAKERAKITGWLKAGKSASEVMALMGQEAWAVPPNHWVAVLASYAALLGGAGALVVLARRATSRGRSGLTTSKEAPTTGDAQDEISEDAEYAARLDDELDDLG